MLETVLAIPLFLVLFSATMWLGDLVLARQRLVIADRFAAWNLGNRHQSADSGGVAGQIQQYFFDPGQPHAKVTLREAKAERPRRWWQQAYARAELRIDMPEWMRAWVALSAVLWHKNVATSFSNVGGRGELAGEGSSHYYSRGHAVLMRAPHSDKDKYFRNWNCKDLDQLLADPENGKWLWTEVPNEPWPADFQDVRDVNNQGKEYDRFGQYVTWSE